MGRLILILFICIGFAAKSQNLGMTALEVRRSIEAKGYEVEIIKGSAGDIQFHTVMDKSYHVFYFNKNNICNAILLVTNIEEFSVVEEVLIESGYRKIDDGKYIKENLKLSVWYSTEFESWVTLLHFNK
jgi:hypothetical protein